jgi:transposase
VIRDAFLGEGAEMAVDKLEVLRKLKMGPRPSEIAKLSDIAESTVKKIEAEAAEKRLLHVGRMSHIDRRKQRKQIADWVKANGATVAQAVERFGESSNRVRDACQEYRVEPAFAGRGRKSSKKTTQTEVIARVIDGMDQADIARELNVSPQYVHLCVRAGREGGIFEAVNRAVERAAKTQSDAYDGAEAKIKNAVDFGENLQLACERGRISQRGLGEVSGVHYTYINAIIHGRSSPTLQMVNRLVAGLQKAGMSRLTPERILAASKDFAKWLDEAYPT